jgi:CubicO group peptidase (beta-lactamase class C family)
MLTRSPYLRHLCVAFLVASLVAPAASAQATQTSARAAELDSFTSALHDDGLFTGVLLIARDGVPVYSAGFGEHEGSPLTAPTPLPLASVTKPVTAAAVLSLVKSGRLELDASVGHYLSDWPYPAVTLRHLLDQTSGLHFLSALNAHADTTRPVTNADVLALVAKHQPGLTFPPGMAFQYDNANYVTLASVAEVDSGQPYSDLLRERVFSKAGTDSARVHAPDHGDAPWLRWIGGDGVTASAEDLMAFDHAFHTGVLVSSAVRAAASKPLALSDGNAGPYRAGWFITDSPFPLVGHFGDGAAVKTGLWREREGDHTYVILMPGNAVHRTPILLAAMQLWRGEPYTLPTQRLAAEVPEEVLSKHVGTYDTPMGRLHIILAGGQLHLEPEGAGASRWLRGRRRCSTSATRTSRGSSFGTREGRPSGSGYETALRRRAGGSIDREAA